jgi:hypothetical protein
MWFANLSEGMPDSPFRTLGIVNRKANLERTRSPVAFELRFEETRTTFQSESTWRPAPALGAAGLRQGAAGATGSQATAPVSVGA